MCMTPFYRKDMPTTPLPCGRCEKCTARRVSGWSYRLMKQYDIAKTAVFVTLTYDTQFVPITPRGFMNLDKRDVQLFMKRLRKRESGKVTYYLCGEYGSKRMRPHYHAIIFDITKPQNIVDAWQLGSCFIGTVSRASVGYTLKYINKPSRIPIHRNDDRQKEFSLMSKKIGKNYLTDAMIAWHKSDLVNRMYVNLEDGKKIAMPRYYKEKIYEPEEREAISEKQKLEQLKKDEKDLQKYGDDLERVKMERVKNSQRRMHKKSQNSKF